jgi:protease PrsW
LSKGASIEKKMTSNDWFLLLGREVIGPVGWPEIEERVRAAHAEQTAQVSANGGATWQPYKSADPHITPVLTAAPVDFMHQRAASASAGIGKFFAEVRALPLSTLFPVATWLRDKPWDLAWVRWFAFFAFYPLVMLRLFQQRISLTNAAWAFGLYFAAIWALIFYFCMRPPAIRVKVLLGTAGFTAFVGIGLLLIAQQLPVIRDFYGATESANFVGRVLGYVLGVGIMEEATKALPLWWRFVHKRVPTTPRECAFIGCVSGLAFGVAEAVSYSIRYAVQQYQGQLGYGDYLTIQFLRLITLPLLHALWAGTVGYFIGLAASMPDRSRALVAVGLTMMALVHGLYDTFSGTWASTALGVLSLLVFVAYSRSADQIATTMAMARTPKA